MNRTCDFVLYDVVHQNIKNLQWLIFLFFLSKFNMYVFLRNF